MKVEEEYELIRKYSQEIIIFFDEKGIIVDSNTEAERILLYEGGIIGISISDIFPQVFPQKDLAVEITTATEIGLVQTVAYRMNKICFPVSLRVAAEGDRFLCAAVDTTNENTMERRLEQTQDEAGQALKTRNEFVANVTHELRTPVNGILGHVQNLMKEDVPASAMETLKIIELCCNNMNKIINNILDFSKLEAGKFTIDEQPVNVRQLLMHVKDTNITKIQEKGLLFSMHIADGIPETIMCDQLKLTQILNNLLSNAIKFTNTGRISMEVMKTWENAEEAELFFMVIDTGIGIDKNERERLFVSFSQVDASITRKFGGTGLGLAISKALVELMGGTISVESEKGKGSSFSFSIRAHKAAGEEDVMQEETQVEETNQPVVFLEITEENRRKEIHNLLEKIVLCIELESWDKAEEFIEIMKELTDGYGEDFRRSLVRIGMAVRKKDHDKSLAAYQKLLVLFEEM